MATVSPDNVLCSEKGQVCCRCTAETVWRWVPRLREGPRDAKLPLHGGGLRPRLRGRKECELTSGSKRSAYGRVVRVAFEGRRPAEVHVDAVGQSL